MTSTSHDLALPTGPGLTFVDPESPIGPDQALALLGDRAKIHTLTYYGFAGGADMDREDVEALIHANKGGYRAAADSRPAIHQHGLALWSAHEDVALGGYWVFIETRGAGVGQ